ncbi:MAG: hypothetical protein GC139_07710 [Sideroxydans sp.]|nr:hypothetical protein [Sideroxydans sp.]
MAEANNKHEWKFFRIGGFDQVRIENGADLRALEQLDQKLWVALSCPVGGIEFDERTLELIDVDGDGHIRAPEVIAAVKWATSLLKDAGLLVSGAQALPLAAIDDSSEQGAHVLAAARRVLENLGKSDADSITVDDTADTQKVIAAMALDGDGVIPPDAVADPALKQVVVEIIDCCGSVAGRCGKSGVSIELVEQFFTQAEALLAWQNKADERVMFLGADTQAAADAWRAVRAKVADYFMRCRLAAYDARAAVPLSRSVEDYQSLAGKDLSSGAEVLDFPLASISAEQPLPLGDGINPAWEAPMRKFEEAVIKPVLGNKRALSEADWLDLQARFAALEQWQAQQPENTVGKLGIGRLQAMMDGGYREALAELIGQDKALADEVDAIDSVERLVRYCRDLYELVNNFVSFRNFYSGAGKAVFQAGTLYLDGRSCELCVPVGDIGKHATLANLSRVCLVYCDCTRNGGKDRMTIAAAFTAGDSDQLMVGRNGVFYDRKGQDWDAVIVRMLEHPISIRQAFWSPYKRAAKMVSEQIQKFAAARSQAAQTKMMAEAVASAGKPAEAKAAPPFDVAKFAGIFAAIGLAVGALGTALAAVVTGLLNLEWWQIPLVLLGVILLISGPAVLIAWSKLKQRNLGPILDANGWAVNARAKINIPFGTALTGVAKLPEGAARAQIDPFAEKQSVWPYFLAALAVLAGLIVWLRLAGYL